MGVNYADVVIRMGLYASAKQLVGWPITPGFEVAGTVDALGAGVRDLRAGDAVARYPLADVARAHADIESGRTLGKLVLEV